MTAPIVPSGTPAAAEAPWPLSCARDVYSQCGEDGIVEAILERLPERDRWCVEFGAWDGRHLSNTRHLIESKGYSAVLIEADGRRCRALAEESRGDPRLHVVNAFVGMTEIDGLDAILAGTPIPSGFDFLSIDIDGNDYHVWEAVRRYRPKIVCIEFNPTIANEIDYVQEPLPQVKRGCSPRALVRLGREKGYELVAVTLVNAVFVDRQYFPLLGIEDNSLELLRRETQHVTHVFHGYDGVLVVMGGQRIPWHEVRMRLRGGSVPRVLRGFPAEYGTGRRLLYYGYRLAKEPRATLGLAIARGRARKHRLRPTGETGAQAE